MARESSQVAAAATHTRAPCARATWHLFSSERDRLQRERLLELLGKHNVVVLCGHCHKYNLIVRHVADGGRFLQLGVCSVIHDLSARPRFTLAGVKKYNADQVKVEPSFSPATEQQRRAVYQTEAPFVRQFQYADLAGHGVVRVNGPSVTAKVYSGIGRRVWRSLNLTKLLQA